MQPRLRRRSGARTNDQVIGFCFARNARSTARGKSVIDLGVTRASFAGIKRVCIGLRSNLKRR